MATRIFGLLGKNIAYSFSRGYFTEKFRALGIDAVYKNFDVDTADAIPGLLHAQNLSGLNVTIPYKEAIVPYLRFLSDDARQIGAVNTVAFADGKTTGYNTDHIGFRDSLKPLLKPIHRKALVLGTGGASKAVVFALKNLGIETQAVSRDPKPGESSYEELAVLMASHHIVVNTTPVGTYPDIDEAPQIPYGQFTPDHIAYNLVYNPPETAFLKKAKAHGATVKNGLDMLRLQAEAAWEIWNA